MPTTPRIAAHTAARTAAIALFAGVAATPAAFAQDAQDLPVTSITLYRSGVGSFERRGTIEDDARVRLRVDEAQLNDLLKSLVVLDLGGGQVEAVSYGSREPVARRLASFGVNLADNPSMAELLSRLRGTRVTAQTADSATTGTIVGVEQRTIAGDDGTRREASVSIFTGAGLTRIDLGDLVGLEFLDERLKQDMQRALAVLDEQRDETIRTVEVASDGDGPRSMIVSYVHEMPVWKTAYRLVLGEGSDAEPILQAWAIVENTTEEDWRDVELALVASQPVGFTMDLQTPLFVQRPQLPVPVGALARAKVYTGDSGVGGLMPEAARQPSPAMDRRSRGRGQSPFADSGDMERAETPQLRLDAMSSMAGRAAAAQVGESIQLRIADPVSLDRRQSAMIPMLTEGVDARKVSIYTAFEQQAMHGVEMANSTGTPLIDGPVSVYDGGAYAGDAQIGYVPADAQRLLAYAVDLELKARTERRSATQRSTFRIVDGVLIQTYGRTQTTIYILRNESGRDRTVIVEHPSIGWTIDTPGDGATTDDGNLRFERSVARGKELRFEVRESTTDRTRYALVDADIGSLIERIERNGSPDADLLEALREGGRLNRRVADLEERVRVLQARVQAITADQSRIRSNMQAIDSGTDLYRRYLGTLNEQEDQLGTLRDDIEQAQRDLAAAEAQRRSYFEKLTVR
ncbi:MAG: hypothetical protein AAFX79_07780 [Planctomycetota bacterium]